MARKKVARKRPAKKRAARKRVIPITDYYDVDDDKKVSLNDVTVHASGHEFSICSVRAWRDKGGIVMDVGGTAMREADWRGPKGVEAAKEYVIGEIGEADANASIGSSYDLEQAINDVVTSHPAGEARDEALLVALKSHVSWDEPEPREAPVEALHKKVLTTLDYAANLLH
jgi:hypothetical protein